MQPFSSFEVMELHAPRLWSLRHSYRQTSLHLVTVHLKLLPADRASFVTATKDQASSVDSGPWLYAATDHSEVKRVAAADVASGTVHVINWLVFLEQDAQFVGKVKDILEIGRLSESNDEGDVQLCYILKVEEGRGHRSSEWSEKVELLVPLVDEFVRNIDVERKRILINPPDGLLELARRPAALKKLRPKILEFCAQQVRGLNDCLQKRRANTGINSQLFPFTTVESSKDAYMPTRRQLHAAGRQDLIDDIMKAGGFLSVAQDLHLAVRRRPSGFWDDLKNVDAEIECFINDSWVKKANPTTGKIVYVNEVTKIISDKARRGNVADPSPATDLIDDIGTAVMPRQKTLKAAGRYDLHHAIALHGGYREVAQTLGRQPVALPPPKKRRKKYSDLTLVALEEGLRCFMEKHGLGYFPSIADLRSEHRTDLVAALIAHGGLGVVADHMGIRPKRYGKRHWSSLEGAAAVLQAYLLVRLREDKGPPTYALTDDEIWNWAVESGAVSIPSELQVMKDGRADLRYIIRKYGKRELARSLNIRLRQETQCQEQG